MSFQGMRISMLITACIGTFLGSLLGTVPVAAQPVFSAADFDCTTALLVDAATTLTLPSDGILCFTSVTVEAGGELRFHRNLANTPVHLLSTGELRISGNVLVDGDIGLVNGGLGGPGGFDGGDPGFDGGEPAVAGQGPGRGLAGGGRASFGSRPSNLLRDIDGQTYGSPLLIPLIGGSGGGGGSNPSINGGGGGGGGAILLASNIRVEITGTIFARGGFGTALNGGSGGAIRVVAPSVAGDGHLAAGPEDARFAGRGRTRIDFLDGSEMNLTSDGAHTVGTFLTIFPENLPRLHITHAAGTDIAPGTQGPVTVALGAGSPTAQTVSVQAENFSGEVDVELLVAPERGDPVVYPVAIDMAGNAVVEVDVEVEIPLDVVSRISAWVR